jgi:hypothetical protein
VSRLLTTPTTYFVDLEPCAASLTNDFGFVFVDATAVRLASFKAIAENGGVRVKWRTSAEMENLGFNVLRSHTAEGQRVQINEAMIPGQGTAVGESYEIWDGTAQAGVTYYYWLEDVDWYMFSTINGPAVVWGTEQRKPEKMAGFKATQAGLYRIRMQTLREAGVDVGGIAPERLQVYVNGREVAALLAVQGEMLRDEDVVYFYLPSGHGAQSVELRACPDALRMEEVYVGPMDGEGDVWCGVAGENNILSFEAAPRYVRHLLMGFEQEPVRVLDVTDSRKVKWLFGYSSITTRGDLGLYLSYSTDKPANCMAVDDRAVIDVKKVTKK